MMMMIVQVWGWFNGGDGGLKLMVVMEVWGCLGLMDGDGGEGLMMDIRPSDDDWWLN